MNYLRKYVARMLLISAALAMFACDGQKPKTELPTSYLAAQTIKRTVVVGTEVRLGQALFDENNTDLTFQWKLLNAPDQSRSALSDTQSVSPRFVADRVGTYVFEVSATQGATPNFQRQLTVTALAIPATTTFDHGTAPDACATCHDGVNAAGKSANHMRTTQRCEACHTVIGWKPVAMMDHLEAVGSCGDCHNNTVAAGKPATHLVTRSDCAICHNTQTWLVMFDWPKRVPTQVFNHVAVAPNTCTSCHNGSTAAGLPLGHIATSNECDQCHHTRAWIPAWLVNETSPTVLACEDCHNSLRLARGKSANHLVTSNKCGACHNTSVFWPVQKVDHAEVLGRCAGCHNNVITIGKPATHIASTDQCESCHNVVAWRPVARIDHTQVLGACASCHRMPARHLRTTRDCVTCHATVGWDIRKKRKA